MAISAEDKIIHHLKDKVGLAEADRLVAQVKKEAQNQAGPLRERLDLLVTDELGAPSSVLVQRLADVIDEARIRAKQDALYRDTEK